MDRELLEMAAKAAGEWPSPEPFEHLLDRWNPLTNRSDAFSLQVKLARACDIDYTHKGTKVHIYVCMDIPGGEDLAEAREEGPADQAEQLTMRAIVRCAAEVGRNMP